MAIKCSVITLWVNSVFTMLLLLMRISILKSTLFNSWAKLKERSQYSVNWEFLSNNVFSGPFYAISNLKSLNNGESCEHPSTIILLSYLTLYHIQTGGLCTDYRVFDSMGVPVFSEGNGLSQVSPVPNKGNRTCPGPLSFLFSSVFCSTIKSRKSIERASN